MHDGNQEWSWVNEDGIEHAVSESELAFALSSEAVMPFMLVWKRGWSEWLPAMQVAELQWALPPGTADAPKKPLISQTGSRRPPPIHRYPEYRRRSEDLKAGLVSATETLASPPSTPSSPPLATMRRETTPALASIAPKERVHLPFSREDEEEPTVQIDGEELERVRQESMDIMFANGDLIAPRPKSSPRSSNELTSPPARVAERLAALERGPGSAPERAERPNAERSPSYAPGPSAPAFVNAPPMDVRPLSGLEARPVLQATHPEGQSAENKRAGRMPLIAIGCALVLGVLGAVWLRFVRVQPTPTPVKPVVTQAAEGPRSPGPKLCQIARPGALLAEWAYPKIEPSFGRLPDPQKLAIGYGQTSRYAVGLTLDVQSMRPEKVFSEFQNSPLLAVIPMTAGRLTFRPTRAAATLQSAIALDAKMPFAFGWTRDGFAVRRDSDAVDKVLWKSVFTTSNVPSVEKLDTQTFAFAMRAGGERGSVLVGKLHETAEAVGELTSLKLPEGRIGLPSMRIGSSRVLVTLTLGASETRGDVYLADSKKPSLPSSARVLTNVAGGVYSPQAVEVTDSTFLLQFTRGEPGNQQVVAQVYDFERNKLGTELAISPGDLDAHAGTLWVVGKQVLSLYMVRTDQAYALWATRLDCE